LHAAGPLDATAMLRIDLSRTDRERDRRRELRRCGLDLGRLVRIRIALPFALL
jgi:hypothetical protein